MPSSYYAEAVERFGRTPLRPELARAHLLYGEWLRREHRRLDARHQLHAAYHLFAEIGADAFAERARRELLATGEKVRKREVDPHNQLTPQEEHIVRLARDGRTNPEIAAELFISTRTVEWHLRKVFTKLGITSRRDLHNALPARGQHAPCRVRPGHMNRYGLPDRDFEHDDSQPLPAEGGRPISLCCQPVPRRSGLDRRYRWLRILVRGATRPPARVPTRVLHGFDRSSRGAIVKQYQL